MFYSAFAGISTNHMKEADSQAPVKLKLQLFPINEATRKALEKVKNGFLLLANCV
jgi:hypothetical protein